MNKLYTRVKESSITERTSGCSFGGRHVTGYHTVFDDPAMRFGGGATQGSHGGATQGSRGGATQGSHGGAAQGGPRVPGAVNGDRFNNNLKTTEVRRYANIVDQLKDFPVLLRHQQGVCKYLDNYHNLLRGFMITHEMGTGKTITAVFALNVLKKHYPDRKLLVIAPKALHVNFRDTIKRFQAELSYTPDEVAYVSSNASNFYDQLMLAHSTPQYAALYKKGKLSIDNEKLFDEKLVVIDEAHNFFSNIANAKHIIKRGEAQLAEYSQAERVYNLILAADAPKIVYMTGTPIANTPFEFAIAANMLKGWTGSGSRRTTVFPEEHSRFNDYFINENGVGMKNMKEFQARIYGCGSFYGKDYYSPETRELFPTFSRHIEYIPMGELQFKKYIDKAIELEGLKSKREGKFKLEVERWEKERDQKYADAMFRISLRQISNVFTPPGYTAESYPKLPLKEKEAIANYFLDDIASYSPKIFELVRKLEASGFGNSQGSSQGSQGSRDSQGSKGSQGSANAGPKTVIYSHFTTTLEFIKIYLRSKGIAFGTVTGEDSAEDRAIAVKKFNDPKSGHNLMIISSAGAEGLDLKGVRAVHILEPQYNLNRIEQIETRGVRFQSHIHLPEGERHVEIYLYVCVFGNVKNLTETLKDVASEAQLEYILGKPSVDVDLYQKSIEKKKTYNDLIACIKKAAVDCYNYRPENECVNAKMVNKPLYELNIPYDISINGYEQAERVNETKSMMRLYAPEGLSFVYKRTKTPQGTFVYEPMAKFHGDELAPITGATMGEAGYHLNQFQKNPEGYKPIFYEQAAPLVEGSRDLVKGEKDYWGNPAEEAVLGGSYNEDEPIESMFGGAPAWMTSSGDSSLDW